ncbi:MAG: signaling protein, partial [Gemmatimonadales bacterium]|nr:signaling protein [Gemmatimonadales bacterium]
HVHLLVAADGDDANPGTEERPLATLARARDIVRTRSERGRVPITVSVGGGTYYLPEPLVLGPEDSGSPEAPVRYVSSPPGAATLSGGRKLDCRWRPFRDGIMMCELPEVRAEGLGFTQLFVNGKRQ